MNQAHNYLVRYIKYAEAGELNSDSPLSIEVNGRYVDVLFCTGGPHFDVQFDYGDAESAEYWFENEPYMGAVAHYADWGESQYVGMDAGTAADLAASLTRDPDWRPCRIERTSLGGGVICAECGTDCDCIVCAD